MQSWLWLPLAFLSALFAALVAIFGKLGLKTVDSTVATTARALVMAAFLLITTAALGRFTEIGRITSKDWVFIVLAGVAGALSWIFYFWALKLGKAGQVATVDKFSVVLVILLASVFLAEKIGWKTGAGALLVTIGTILIALA
jgi:transporter family protein